LAGGKPTRDLNSLGRWAVRGAPEKKQGKKLEENKRPQSLVQWGGKSFNVVKSPDIRFGDAPLKKRRMAGTDQCKMADAWRKKGVNRLSKKKMGSGARGAGPQTGGQRRYQQKESVLERWELGHRRGGTRTFTMKTGPPELST